MATGPIKAPIKELYAETASVSFSNGIYKLPAKTGYLLVNAYIRGRDSSERNSYAVISIQQNNDGSYNLRNQHDTLTSSIFLRTVWMKDE